MDITDKDVKIVNLTPHDLHIYNEEGNQVVTVFPSGKVARLEVRHELEHRVNNIPIYKTYYSTPQWIDEEGKTVPIPNRLPNTIYVTSGLFRSRFSRVDIYQPGELLRDAEGKVIGCVGLSQ